MPLRTNETKLFYQRAPEDILEFYHKSVTGPKLRSFALCCRNDYNSSPSPAGMQQEVKLWESHWLRSAKELDQWEVILDYGSGNNNNGTGTGSLMPGGDSANAMLVLESAWKRTPNWAMMRDALTQVGNIRSVFY